MKKTFWAKWSCLLFAFVFLSAAQGFSADKEEKSKVDEPWEKVADKNKDGKVGPKEAAKAVKPVNIPKIRPAAVKPPAVKRPPAPPAVKKPADVKAQSKVNTPWENAADKNDDGRVSGKEFGQWNKEGNNPPGMAGGPGRGAPPAGKKK